MMILLKILYYLVVNRQSSKNNVFLNLFKKYDEENYPFFFNFFYTSRSRLKRLWKNH